MMVCRTRRVDLRLELRRWELARITLWIGGSCHRERQYRIWEAVGVACVLACLPAIDPGDI